MSSSHASPPRSPRERFSSNRGAHPYDVRHDGDRQRPRSRSPERRRGSTSRARRGKHRREGHSARDPEADQEPDPESYYGTRGRSYRPVYDRSPLRDSSPRQPSDRDSPLQPRFANHSSRTYHNGEIIVSRQDQQEFNTKDLRVRQGDSLRILKFVSGSLYRCENLQSGHIGHVHSKVFEGPSESTKPPESLVSETERTSNQLRQPSAVIQTLEMDGVEIVGRSENSPGKINPEVVQTLQDVFSKIFEVSIDTASTKLQRDAAEEIVGTRKADFDKSKEYHEKFPQLKESQTKQKLEAQKKFAALDQQLKDLTTAAQGLITNAIHVLVPTIAVEKRVPDQLDFERQLMDIQRDHNGLKELVKSQTNLLNSLQEDFSKLQEQVEKAEDIKSLKADIAQVKRNVDTTFNPISQRLDDLEPQHKELRSQVQNLVDYEKVVRDDFKKADSRIQAIEQEKDVLQLALTRLVKLENDVFQHGDNIMRQQNDFRNLTNTNEDSIRQLNATTDRVDQIEGRLEPLGVRIQTLEAKSLDLLDSGLKKAVESAALSSGVEDRLKNLETKIAELQNGMTESHSTLGERIQTMEARSSEFLNGELKRAGEALALSSGSENRLQNLESNLAEIQKNMVLSELTAASILQKVSGIESQVASGLDQSKKTATELQQAVVAVEHGLANLRSRVDNIWTSHLAKAIVQQVDCVYPNLKNVNETVVYLNNQIVQITREISRLCDNNSVEGFNAALQEVRQSIAALQHPQSQKEDAQAVNKTLAEFTTQYNMDYSTASDATAGLKNLLTEKTKLIEKLQSDLKTFSMKVEEAAISASLAIDLAKKADEQCASLKVEITRNNISMEKLQSDREAVPTKVGAVATASASSQAADLAKKATDERITSLEERMIQTDISLKRLQSDGEAISNKCEGVATATSRDVHLATKIANERINAIEVMIPKSEKYIKEKLEVPLQQIKRVAEELKSIEKEHKSLQKEHKSLEKEHKSLEIEFKSFEKEQKDQNSELKGDFNNAANRMDSLEQQDGLSELGAEVKNLGNRMEQLEQKDVRFAGKVNDHANRLEKLERRRTTPVAPPLSVKRASHDRTDAKKRPSNGNTPSAKRRNTAIESDRNTIYMPACKEESLREPTVEDSEGE